MWIEINLKPCFNAVFVGGRMVRRLTNQKRVLKGRLAWLTLFDEGSEIKLTKLALFSHYVFFSVFPTAYSTNPRNINGKL